jgi:hypothetical protein
MLGQFYDWTMGGILGAVIALVLPWAYVTLRRTRHRRQQGRRHDLVLNTTTIYAWLRDYYIGRGRADDLYICRFPEAQRRVPFLSSPEWTYTDAPLPGVGDVVRLRPRVSAPHPVDHKALKRRQRLGQRLFDGPAVSLVGLDQTDGLALDVEPCDYFSIATTIIGFEEETFRAASRTWPRRARTPLRDRYLGSADVAGRLEKQPRSLGCVFLMAARSETSYDLLLHRRSHETVSFGGAYAAIPNFGIEPLGFDRRDGRRGQDLLTQNFIKEYLEELFNYEELISSMSSRRADPSWFMRLSEAKDLQSMIDAETLATQPLGFGFDALNGNGILAMLGILEDPTYIADLRDSIELNWEVAGDAHRSVAVDFVDMESPSLDDWLQRDEIHPGAAFAISQALPVLRTRTARTGPS